MFLADLPYIINWWLMFFIIGVITLPVSWLIFKKFVGVGYGLSKSLGVLFTSYIVFLLGILHLAKFTYSTIILILFLILIIDFYIFVKKKDEILTSLKNSWIFILIEEVLFSFGLFFWSFVRGHQPDIRGLEKFMDFGFVNSALKGEYLPPADMWAAGHTINYYWFGHFMTAVLTKLSNIPSEITYNLMLAAIMGLTLTTAFIIVASLVKSIAPKNRVQILVAAGIISALLLTFAGNFHTPYYVLKEGSQNYWYPDATRFIGYNPDTNDKTIHEFPIYSFVVADLHAHLINLPFVLFYIAVLWKLVSEINFTNNSKNKGRQIDYKIPIFAGFVLGTFFMTSTWDFGNYLLVTGVTLSVVVFKERRFKFDAIWDVAKILIPLIVFAGVTALPFIINFTSIAEGVKFVHSHTPLWQLLILWGYPLVLTIFFAKTLYKLKTKITLADTFVLSLLITAWILIALPEIIYVKDIYAATHYRANTMFKLTYQAYVMSYLTSGYIVLRLLLLTKDKYLKFLQIMFWGVVFYSILAYSQLAINSYYGGLKVYRGLDGINWLSQQYSDQYAVINWLRDNTPDQSVILEAPGDSYTDSDVISSYTGLPTISGWFVHEWLWRGTPEFPQTRVADITTIYNSADAEAVRELLKKYNVSYVIVASFERQKFPYLNETKFYQIATPVFSVGGATIFKVNPN